MTANPSLSGVREAADQLFVTSHVGRDFLQCAQTFQSEKRVIWEYVANSIQYVDVSVTAEVDVRMETAKRRITIRDNGRGMAWSGAGGLQDFFIMHGENADRLAGHKGRGRFGTGKSAAFGIANVLRIATVRDSRRCSVQLSRADIEHMRSGDPIPICTLEKNIPTDEPNGTVVEIADVQLSRLDIAGTRRFIERHLRHLPAQADVRINGRACEWQEPPSTRTLSFRPAADLAAELGDVELLIKIAKAPLPAEQRGIAISSNGVWLETTLAGAEGREMAQYIFGYLDVPALEDDESAVPPFDMTRRVNLNAVNRIVQLTYSFCGRHIEAVRRQLIEAEKQRRRTLESERLREEALHIQQLLNDDFRCWRFGTTLAHGHDWRERAQRSNGTAQRGSPVRRKAASANGSARARGEFALRPTREKPPSSFRVRFRNDGAESYRAFYDESRRAIYINMDHPQMVAAKSIDDGETSLRRLAYEAAFAEYAIALQEERAERGDYVDLADILREAREVIDRLGRRCAVLYE